MTKPPALPMLTWWPSDYFSATRAFTLAERGAYTDLLFYSWLNGPLPHEPERLARLIGVTPQEFAEVWPTVRSKFEATAQGLINRRLERERVNAVERKSKASQKARDAAKARWPGDAPSSAPSNARSNAPGIAAPPPEPRNPDLMVGAMLEQCPPSPSPSPSPPLSPSPSPSSHVGGGKEGTGEKRGNLSEDGPKAEGPGPVPRRPPLNAESGPTVIQMWEATRLKILDAIAEHPEWTNEQIADEALARSVTKEQVAAAKRTQAQAHARTAS